MKRSFEEKVAILVDGKHPNDIAMAATGCLAYIETLADTPDNMLRERLKGDTVIWREVYKRSTGENWGDLDAQA